MSTDPQAPDGGYALTPETSSGSLDTTTESSPTAHHEELLRTEALAARQGNRAIARFAVIGLTAALAVGVLTWRSTVPGAEKTDNREVVDTSADSTLDAASTKAPQVQIPRTSPKVPTPVPDSGFGSAGGVVPLRDDPYLPPNAWNGGERLVPTNSPDKPVDDITDNPVQLFPNAPTDATTSDHPAFPALPTFPIDTVEPTEPENDPTTAGSTASDTGRPPPASPLKPLKPARTNDPR